MNILDDFEKEQIIKNVPSFFSGDIVVVKIKVLEGSKIREQIFEGYVIAKRNRGINSSFTVRKISNGIGVEKVFQIYSPSIVDITIKRSGCVRRAKLYYLRKRFGKSVKIKEKLKLKKK